MDASLYSALKVQVGVSLFLFVFFERIRNFLLVPLERIRNFLFVLLVRILVRIKNIRLSLDLLFDRLHPSKIALASLYSALVQVNLLTAKWGVNLFLCFLLEELLVLTKFYPVLLSLLYQVIANVVYTLLVAMVGNLYLFGNLRGFSLVRWSDRRILGYMVATSVSYCSFQEVIYWYHLIAVTFWATCIIYIRDQVPQAVPVPDTHFPAIPNMKFFMWLSLLFYSAAEKTLSRICADGHLSTSGIGDVALGFSYIDFLKVSDGLFYFGVYGGLFAETFAALWALWLPNTLHAKYKGAVFLILATLPSLLLVELTAKGTPNPYLLMFVVIVAGSTARGAISLLREAWAFDLTTVQTMGMSILAFDFACGLGIAISDGLIKLWNLPVMRYYVVALGFILAICMSVPDPEEGSEETHRKGDSQDPPKRDLPV